MKTIITKTEDSLYSTIDYLKHIMTLDDIEVGETVVVKEGTYAGKYVKLSNAIVAELEVLNSLCDNIEHKGLWDNELDAEFQLWDIAVNLTRLGLSFKDMIDLGRNHSYESTGALISDLICHYHLTIEDVIGELLKENLDEDKIDKTLDGITMQQEGSHDSTLVPFLNKNSIDFAHLTENFSVYEVAKVVGDEEDEIYGLYGRMIDYGKSDKKEENLFLLEAMRKSARRVVERHRA